VFDSPLASDPEGMSEARRRVVVAAQELFRQRGVSGTSMQRVADQLGVTKGAVFYHFRTKQELAEASVELELDAAEEALRGAESSSSAHAAKEVLLEFMVDRAVERRRDATSLHDDPVLVGIRRGSARFRDITRRFYGLLFDLDEPQGRVDAAMLHAALSQGVLNSLIAGLDDMQLRRSLLRSARRFLA